MISKSTIQEFTTQGILREYNICYWSIPEVCWISGCRSAHHLNLEIIDIYQLFNIDYLWLSNQFSTIKGTIGVISSYPITKGTLETLILFKMLKKPYFF